MWLMPVPGTSGFLVAKATLDGSTRFYTIEMAADGGSYIIRFSYLPATSQVSAVASCVKDIKNVML